MIAGFAGWRVWRVVHIARLTNLRNKVTTALDWSMFLHPHYEAAAILFRPMVPFEPTLLRNFGELAVFISAGTTDPIVPRSCPEQLAAIFESGGADVSLFWHDGGHELGDDDLIAAKQWLSDKLAKRLVA